MSVSSTAWLVGLSSGLLLAVSPCLARRARLVRAWLRSQYPALVARLRLQP